MTTRYLTGIRSNSKRYGKRILRGAFNFGYCPICEHRTLFVKEGEYLRNDYRCFYCHSIPRWRAVIHVLQMLYPRWRDLEIHESSPGGAGSDKLRNECHHYTSTNYYPGVPPGSLKDGTRCENLEQMTFGDYAFDLVITQDVFEHLLRPDRAFAEVARTLRVGGAHIFTVPYYGEQKTRTRAVPNSEGIHYLEKPVYHLNPTEPSGSLVVRDWGYDLIDFILIQGAMATTIYNIHDLDLGLAGEFLEVFVSRKVQPS
jgi:hypothetical protein